MQVFQGMSHFPKSESPEIVIHFLSVWTVSARLTVIALCVFFLRGEYHAVTSLWCQKYLQSTETSHAP